MKQQLAQALIQYMNQHQLSQQDAAQSFGVSQPVLSRIKNGSWIRQSQNIKRVAEKLDVQRTVDPSNSILLMSALKEAWDGEEESEKLLADAIKSLGKLAQKRNFT